MRFFYETVGFYRQLSVSQRRSEGKKSRASQELHEKSEKKDENIKLMEEKKIDDTDTKIHLTLDESQIISVVFLL